MDAPPPDDVARTIRALGVEPDSWRPATRGERPTRSRWVVTLPDGSGAFVKIGYSLETAAWLRDEHRFYVHARGLPFLPAMLGWYDDDERPVLALEDLSRAVWPPPWNRALVEAVLAALDRVAATPPPPDLLTERQGQFDLNGWPELRHDPEPFLQLGLCSETWLLSVAEPMADAAARAPLAGDALLHGDVRGDNLCLRAGAVAFVDWNLACLGNPRFDVAAWLPSLHAEGGPAPETILGGEDAGAFAALLAGYFSARAARPAIPEAPHVRPLQLMQARTALPWAARTLGLPPPTLTRLAPRMPDRAETQVQGRSCTCKTLLGCRPCNGQVGTSAMCWDCCAVVGCA